MKWKWSDRAVAVVTIIWLLAMLVAVIKYGPSITPHEFVKRFFGG